MIYFSLISAEAERKDTFMRVYSKASVEENQAKRICEVELEALLRQGARRMLEQAIDWEVHAYVSGAGDALDENGRHQVVRNGYHQEREIQTGIGPLPVKVPRVKDKRPGCKFTSAILPPYMRKTPSIEALLPCLYLKGISSKDFPEALTAIVGPNAKGLSSNTILRLKKVWEQEYANWNRRPLSGKRYAYMWVDGIYFNVRLTDDRPCVLVIVGATQDGEKEVLAIHDGERESALSWREVLLDLKRRGLTEAPELAIGDGALGFWNALEEVFPKTRLQRCWVHKTANILDKLPKSVQPSAKSLIHEMYMAETEEDALKAYDEFMKRYGAKYPKACECLAKDKDVLFTFYDFPAEHWIHIRTTNPIESTFATVRHRTRQTKGGGSRTATLSMVFKLIMEAQKRWKRLRGYQLIAKVIEGVKFVDGIQVEAA